MNYYPGRSGFNNGFGQQQQGQQRQYKDNQGKAWVNNSPNRKPNSPHFRGVMTVGGIQYDVSIWFGHHPQKGDEMSIKLSPKQEQRRQQFQNGPTYNGFQQRQPQGHTYSFAPSGQPQNGFNAGPPQGFNQPNYQQQPPQHQPPAGNAVPPPPSGPADYGMEGYEQSEDDFPGF